MQCRWFEYFILFVILINSVTLAAYDYGDRLSLTTRNSTIDSISVILTLIYTAEAALKIAAYGFFMNKKSYMRKGWNIIDFVVVVSG